MIDLSEVTVDSDFAQPFTLTRYPGTWGIGEDGIGFQPEPAVYNLYGVVQPAKDDDTAMMPEGDRIEGAQVFHCPQQMFNSQGSLTFPQLADIINWNGNKYRVQHVHEEVDFGYYRAVGIRMSGE